MSNELKENNGTNYRTLPEMCMMLHMHHTGSSETLSDEHYIAGVRYLRRRVADWELTRNGPRWYCFDTQVLAMCLVTLDEADKYIAMMPKAATIATA